MLSFDFRSFSFTYFSVIIIENNLRIDASGQWEWDRPFEVFRTEYDYDEDGNHVAVHHWRYYGKPGERPKWLVDLYKVVISRVFYGFVILITTRMYTVHVQDSIEYLNFLNLPTYIVIFYFQLRR